MDRISALPEDAIAPADAALLAGDSSVTATIRLKWEPFHLLLTGKKRFEIMFSGSIAGNCKYVRCRFTYGKDPATQQTIHLFDLLFRILGFSPKINPPRGGCHKYTFRYTPYKSIGELPYVVDADEPYTVCWLGELVWQSDTCGDTYKNLCYERRPENWQTIFEKKTYSKKK